MELSKILYRNGTLAAFFFLNEIIVLKVSALKKKTGQPAQ